VHTESSSSINGYFTHLDNHRFINAPINSDNNTHDNAREHMNVNFTSSSYHSPPHIPMHKRLYHRINRPYTADKRSSALPFDNDHIINSIKDNIKDLNFRINVLWNNNSNNMNASTMPFSHTNNPIHNNIHIGHRKHINKPYAHATHHSNYSAAVIRRVYRYISLDKHRVHNIHKKNKRRLCMCLAHLRSRQQHQSAMHNHRVVHSPTPTGSHM
jgi:hypothetical protein